ncbi:MAG: hypothetical protein LBS29_04870 [Endomicrobium sp.]|jgi:hypothetical protein|nr:hypothetical protein [Endomicrobium sp.]
MALKGQKALSKEIMEGVSTAVNRYYEESEEYSQTILRNINILQNEAETQTAGGEGEAIVNSYAAIKRHLEENKRIMEQLKVKLEEKLGLTIASLANKKANAHVETIEQARLRRN